MSFLSVPVSLFPTKPARMIGEINVQVVMSENSSDTLTITKQPVQQGASITDHSYMEPTVLTMTMYFRDNITKSLSKIYQELLDLQKSRVPFNVVTPKRIYRDVLIATLSQQTDPKTENCLAITMAFQEVLLVQVTTTQVPRDKQRNPGATAKTENVGKKSILSTGFDAITGLFQ